MTRPRSLLVAAVAGLLVLGAAAPAAAEPSLDRHGWWWRHQTGTLFMLPPPPGVPEEGLYVANDPTGPEAVSALLYRVSEDDADEAMATLELVVAEGFEGPAEGARIYACPITETWVPGTGEAERWSDRPEGDCEAAMVPGEIPGAEDFDPDAPSDPGDEPQQDEDALEEVRLVWQLTDAFKDGRSWNVLLTPHPEPDPEEPEDFAPFRVAFEHPEEGLFELGDPFDFGDFGAEPAEVPGFDDDPAPAPAPAAPTGGQTVPAPQTPAQPDPPAEPQGPAPAAQQPPFEGQQTAGPVPEALGPATMLAAVVLLGVLAAVWWLSQQPQRAPRLLGPLAHREQASTAPPPQADSEQQARPRGVGRFRRPRSEPPRRIY